MFYRICLILNSVLSILLIVLVFYVVLIEGDTSTGSLKIATSILVPAIFLICFDLICFKVDKMNRESVQVSAGLKITGKVFFVFTVLVAIAIILVTGSTINSYKPFPDSRNNMRIISLVITIVLFNVLCFTSIVNLVFFSKSIRKNKTLVNEVIHKIGVI